MIANGCNSQMSNPASSDLSTRKFWLPALLLLSFICLAAYTHLIFALRSIKDHPDEVASRVANLGKFQSVFWIIIFALTSGLILRLLLKRKSGKSWPCDGRSKIDDCHAMAASPSSSSTSSSSPPRFLGTLCHELRTPLHGIVGMGDLLSRTELDTEQRDQVQAINENARVMQGIVNDLLDFSELQAGNVSVSEVSFDLEACLRSAMRRHAGEASRKGILLSCRVMDELPTRVLGDQERLRQIVSSLLKNALSRTDRGDILLSAIPGSVTGEIEIRVEDSGSGLSESELNLLRHPESARREPVEMNLDLAVILTDSMQGALRVDSSPSGDGALRLTLPLVAADAESGGDAPGRVRILLAEDNVFNQRVAVSMLESLGHEVDLASNGVEVLELAERNDYDLVFLDVQMPEMDGLRAAQALRKQPTGEGLKLVALTANAMQDNRSACLEAGMDDFLAKPFLIADMEAVIRRHCG